MRIGLTQRVEEIKAYKERRDCLDQQWAVFCETMKGIPVPLSNSISDIEYYLSRLELDALIFTGGNDLASLPNPNAPAPERDRFEKEALIWARKNRKPTLGVCRGMQFINSFFDGKLKQAEGHAGTLHQIFYDNQSFSVNSYHNWVIAEENLGMELCPIAVDETGNIEAFRHEHDPLLGIMWHPERGNLSEFTFNLIHNFLTENK